MKKFLAIYTGTPTGVARSQWNKLSEPERKQREKEGMDAWVNWGKKHAAAILEMGGPLGKTKSVTDEGVNDIKNVMAGYVIIQAETHEAAAKMFDKHPHFTIFPGDAVEIMEVLPVPSA